MTADRIRITHDRNGVTVYFEGEKIAKHERETFRRLLLWQPAAIRRQCSGSGFQYLQGSHQRGSDQLAAFPDDDRANRLAFAEAIDKQLANTVGTD
jgi:hypothetical protein